MSSDAAAVAVDKLCLDDRRIAEVSALRVALIVEHDVGEALLLLAGQQAREDGVGIEARKAPPHEAAARIDERRDAAIADQREVERLTAGRLFRELG